MSHYGTLNDYLQGEDERLQMLKDSNIDFEHGLVIDGLFLSGKEKGEKGYSITDRVGELIIDEHGIKGDRHRNEEGFRPSLRESHIYPKGSNIRAERHMLTGTQEMLDKISQEMGLDKGLTPEVVGWNMLLARKDGEPVYLEGLPIGTDFMVYPENGNPENREELIVNLRLVTQQNGCGITGKNVADTTGEKAHFKSFQEYSKLHRGSILVVDGPTGEHMLKTKQRVFIGLPTGHIK